MGETKKTGILVTRRERPIKSVYSTHYVTRHSDRERWEPIPWDGAMRESWREDDSGGESEDGVGFFEGDGERGEGSDRER